MIHIYTTENVTQNQDLYNNFIESIIPLLSSIPCPKCGMIGLLILYGTYERKFINDDFIRIKIHVQRVQCSYCGSTHVILPTTILPYFLHILLNIKNAFFSDSEMNITYADYLKRRFFKYTIQNLHCFHQFFSIVHSTIKKRNIFYGFVIRPT